MFIFGENKIKNKYIYAKTDTPLLSIYNMLMEVVIYTCLASKVR
jgi:hypothetical protein